jgi:hypothetical protein
MRFLAPSSSSNTPSIIGGSFANSIVGVASVISGGGTSTLPNSIQSSFGFLGGGRQNKINTVSDFAGLAGGEHNEIDSARHTFIGGGQDNRITPGGWILNTDPDEPEWSSIVGGHGNIAMDPGTIVGGGEFNLVGEEDAAILGGVHNTVLSPLSGIVGGFRNRIGIDNVESGSDESFIGGGDTNTIDAGLSVIGGGTQNRIISGANESIIGGGATNQAEQSLGIIGGGQNNKLTHVTGEVMETNSAILGGETNRIVNSFSALGGGQENLIDTSANFSFLGGGVQNTISPRSTHSVLAGGELNFIASDQTHSAIGGGNLNAVKSEFSVIAGGDTNRITSGAHHSFIGGGRTNQIDGFGSVIVGGDSNLVDGPIVSPVAFDFIGGGTRNTIIESSTLDFPTVYSTIGGGNQNSVDRYATFIGGGELNTVWHEYSMIGAGFKNRVESAYSGIASGDSNNILLVSTDPGFEADHSFIGGGLQNTIQSQYCVIGGGRQNRIETDQFSSLLGFIGGGDSNSIEIGCHFGVVCGGNRNSNGGNAEFMGGGEHNRIHDNTQWNTLVAGKWNWIGYGRVPWSRGVINSSLVGGDSNSVYADNASMIGGHLNVIDNEANFSTLGGGINNYIHPHAVRSTIAGGSFNHILDAGQFAAIPGGDSLIAQSYAQTVMGFNNIARSNFTQGSNPAGVDDPMVIVGNGIGPKTVQRSNAFEVSYDGHTTVFDQLGNASPRPAMFGATYNDNIIDAWGDVQVAVGTYTPTNDFAVVTVNHVGAGIFVVQLQSHDPNTGVARNYSGASITVTVNDDSPQSETGVPGYATASHIGVPAPNQFIVRTYNCTCGPQDRPFFFKVSGR